MTNERNHTNTLSIVGNLDLDNLETELHFADGSFVRVPTAMLQKSQFPEVFQEDRLTKESEILIPLVEEQLQVGKRTVETGKVRLHKSVEAFDVTLDEPLAINRWKVERVAKHEVVAEAPLTRMEGTTTIYPIVEERLILTKELVLIEEVRVTPETAERHDPQTVTLRRENLNVEHELSEQR